MGDTDRSDAGIIERQLWPDGKPANGPEQHAKSNDVPEMEMGSGMRDPFSTAVHECGHASVQAVLGVGPRRVLIKCDSGGWSGQSLPNEDANSDKKIVRFLVTQLAGPIAQIVVASESLGDLRDRFRDALLEPTLALLSDPDRPINRLGWEGDLRRCGLETIARSVESCWSHKPIYRRGGFLFRAERALFDVFRAESIQAGLVEIANVLVRQESIDGDAFRSLAADVLRSSAWENLQSMDLSFDLSGLITWKETSGRTEAGISG